MTKQENTILKTSAILIDKGNKYFSKNYLFFDVDDLGNSILLSPTRYKARFQNSLDGMQIIYDKKTCIFEVSEFQAGIDEDCLYIYTETKSFKKAIRSLLKGNYNHTTSLFRLPKKIWN